jgi:hypothetical protein
MREISLHNIAVGLSKRNHTILRTSWRVGNISLHVVFDG